MSDIGRLLCAQCGQTAAWEPARAAFSHVDQPADHPVRAADSDVVEAATSGLKRRLALLLEAAERALDSMTVYHDEIHGGPVECGPLHADIAALEQAIKEARR